MDKIFIEGLKIRGRHGVSPSEREAAQEFVLNISIEFDTRTAAASDKLKDTIDYSGIRKAAKEVVKHSSFHLIEKLADAVAQKILEDFRISNVSVTVRKVGMYDDCTPGVTVVRKR